jgi:Leucine-rich repeat (LRR) protein
MKTKITFLFVFFAMMMQAQDYITFADADFKTALLANTTTVDLNGDGEIQFTEASAFTGELEMNNASISNASELSYFENISSLALSNNDLTTLDLTVNTSLTTINLNDNNLTNLNINGLDQLITLRAHDNQLTHIDLNTNTSLNNIYIYNNNLETLDLFSLTALRNIYCYNNSLYTLDLSQAQDLYRLKCYNNNLVSLNLRTAGAANTPTNTLDCDTNPNLTCINVKSPSTFTAVVPNVTIPAGASFSITCTDYVSVPDSNFEQELIDLGVDTEAGINHVIKRADAEGVTGVLDLDFLNINSLIGIEAFINLTTLRAAGNNLTSINVAAITNLEGLILFNNNISTIDVSSNMALKTLYLSNNDIASIDLTANTALKYFQIANNDLTSINLISNTALQTIFLDDNNLNNLVFANHPYLQTVHCAGNAMSGVLYIDNSPNLTGLYCNNNQLENDDIVINNSPNIQTFEAQDNLLGPNLDFSEMTSVVSIDVSNNPALEGIDMRNGNNTVITSFDATSNPSLSMICVDDAVWSATAPGWAVADVALYNTCYIAIPDANFEQALIDLGIDSYHDNPATPSPNGFIDLMDPDGITYLNLYDENIGNLTGINNFLDLETLIVNDNNLTGLDVSALSHLETLNAKSNNLDSYYIHLPNSSSLKKLYLDNNQEFFGGNNLNDVIANQSLLEELTLALNNAQFLEITNFPNLTKLDCSRNPDIDELDFSNSPNIKTILASDCSLGGTISLNILTALQEVDFSYNDINTLNIGAHSSLSFLRCSSNNLTTLDVSACPSLDLLRCGLNDLTELDVSHNANLTSLYCSSNQLENLYLKNTNNSNMTAFHFDATNNLSTICIEVDDVAWSTTNWASSVDDVASFNTDCSTAAISEIDETAFTVYPNPVKNLLSITTNNTVRISQITLCDVLGKQLTTTTDETIDISNLNKGVYFIKIMTSDKKVFTKKIIKQ